MPTVNVETLRAGSVLAAPISGPGGRELAPAGQPLSDKQIQALRAWGVTVVELASAAPRPNEQLLQAARRSVAPRFRSQPTDHPAIRALFAIAVTRHIATAGR
jgi:hypothetical protein